MCAERNYGLSLPVMLFDESIYRHGLVAPPVGITNEYHIVIFYLHIAFDGRTGFGVHFLFCYFCTFLVGLGIWLYRFYPKQLATGFFGNHFCYDVCVAFSDITHSIILARPQKECH